jgi:hypothetical protein
VRELFLFFDRLGVIYTGVIVGGAFFGAFLTWLRDRAVFMGAAARGYACLSTG